MSFLSTLLAAWLLTGLPPGGPTRPGAARLAHAVRPAALFGYPDGVAVGPDGSLYVVDTDSAALKRISPAGVVTRLAAGYLRYPTAVAVAADGTAYVADAGSRCVVRVAPAGRPTPLPGPSLTYPCGVAVAADGTLYVADAGRAPGSGVVFRQRPGEHFQELATALPHLGGLVLAASGTVCVTDVEHSNVLKISATGEVTPLPVSGLNQPHGLALAADGTLYVADTYNHRVQCLSPAGDVRTLAGGFAYPSGVALDAAGNVYVTDTGHGALQKISPAGVVMALPDAPTLLPGPTVGSR